MTFRIFGTLAKGAASGAPTVLLLLSASALAATTPDSQTVSPDKKVLVMNIRAIGVDEAILPALVSDVAQAISKQPGYSASTMEDLKEILSHEATRELMGCDDAECMAAINNQLNADWVLSGSLGQISKSFILNLALTDANKAATGAKVSETRDTVEQLREALPALLAQLFGWEGGAAKIQFK
ncbi:hypothetical protein KAI87_03155, partial [Myxococcota bacterium]|nr:hypothetical protein [Myxococcota bacterium]